MSGRPLLETLGLTKRFGERTAVNGVGIRVEEGDIYGFLGSNGSGKTTVIRLATGLMHPDSGEVRIAGYDLKTDFKRAIGHVGAIVENPAFYPHLSAFDNLKLMANLIPGAGRRSVQQALETVGLQERAGDKVRSFSLGMRQRLGLAGALLHRPKLVILDEPTNGLDPQGMREIKELIVRLRDEGMTFMLSSHLLNEVEQLCTRVGVVHRGRLLMEGKVEELLRSSDTRSLEDLFFEAVGSGTVVR